MASLKESFICKHKEILAKYKINILEVKTKTSIYDEGKSLLCLSFLCRNKSNLLHFINDLHNSTIVCTHHSRNNSWYLSMYQ